MNKYKTVFDKIQLSDVDKNTIINYITQHKKKSSFQYIVVGSLASICLLFFMIQSNQLHSSNVVDTQQKMSAVAPAYDPIRPNDVQSDPEMIANSLQDSPIPSVLLHLTIQDIKYSTMTSIFVLPSNPYEISMWIQPQTHMDTTQFYSNQLQTIVTNESIPFGILTLQKAIFTIDNITYQIIGIENMKQLLDANE